MGLANSTDCRLAFAELDSPYVASLKLDSMQRKHNNFRRLP